MQMMAEIDKCLKHEGLTDQSCIGEYIYICFFSSEQ